MAASSAPAGTAQQRARRRKRWLIEAGLILTFWTMLALLTLGNMTLSPRASHGLGSPRVLYTLCRFGVWMLLTPLVFGFCRRFPLDEGRGIRNAVLHLALAFFAAAFVDLAGDLLRQWVAPRPRFHFSLAALLRDFLGLRILYEFTIYLAVLAAGFARSYFLRLRAREAREARLEARADRLQRQLTEARLQALRMQLNPHFLFNTLHAVSTLVGEDPAGVRRMIARLSELLRHVLEEAGRDEVPLREEMQFLRAYLDIMQIRFQGRLNVALDAPHDTEDALVPNLILQPLVENAIKHGASEVEGLGRIAVRARRDGGCLLLQIRDNGPRYPEGDTPELEDGTGLKNVRARLEELHGADAALTFQAAEGGGLVARLALPYHTAADLHTQARPEVMA